MPPKRAAKSKASGDGSATAPAKRARLVAEYKWEYEADKHVWTQYSAAINTTLSDAFNGGKKQVDFDLSNGSKMAVLFDKSVQKNKKTGWERPVRLAIKDPSDSAFYTWKWEDEKGNYNAYGVGNCLKLEEAYHKGDSTVNIEACHRSYTVDVKKMEQTNTVTDVTRKVSREKTDGVKSDPEAPEPVASSSTSTDTKAARSGRGRSGRKAKEEPEEEEEEDEVDVKAAKSGGKSKSGAKERPAVKKVVMTGKAPVDPECTSLQGKAHVYYEGTDIYDCMLNQTNVSNNNNKYFVIQLLEADGKKSYYTWFRWGRVGYGGQNSLVPHGPNLDAAKKSFMKKFSDKTKNNWADRKKFQKFHGKYDLLEMDYSAKDTDETDSTPSLKKEPSAEVPDSKLDKRIQTLVELICDVKSMEEAVMEMEYDAKKAPLGKLTTDQIKAGYAALKKIDSLIDRNVMGNELMLACDEFYTRIPHDFGMRPPSKITTKKQVKSKIALLEALGDIQIAIKMLKQGDTSENPVDRHYHSMKCDLVPVDRTSVEFGIVDKYLQNTHASTHSHYKMKILELFDVSKHGEGEKFNDCGNRHLLWHGSRLTNWAGILSQGLRIAPPEAPVTGYMFGKGVYFADMSSKSANYCFATRAKNVGLLLLCDVALGNTNDLLAADYRADKLPAGKHSVKGVGKVAPDPSQFGRTKDGVIVPLGKGKDMGITNPKGYTLNYNEFIVYNTNQIKMKYLLKVEFKF